MNQINRHLKINLSELDSAFENQSSSSEIFYHMDLETGEVVTTTEEETNILDTLYENYKDPQTGAIDWPAVLPLFNIPEWQYDCVRKADQIENEHDTRFIDIPHRLPFEGYNEMVAFIETISNPRLQSQLEQAIRGKGAFRRFKDVLYGHPKEQEDWYTFQGARLRQHVLKWLEEQGIEPI